MKLETNQRTIPNLLNYLGKVKRKPPFSHVEFPYLYLEYPLDMTEDKAKEALAEGVDWGIYTPIHRETYKDNNYTVFEFK